jgi:lipid II:glycine glycyltransferase (peptidoglycan interpeptide bridge formation enzyme)
LHELDLSPGAEALFTAFHRSSIQRKIRRAHREGLTYQDGAGDSLLERFYQLLIMTRLRHQLPPQPRSWFRQLAAQFGSAMKVRIASQAGRAVAAIVTLRHRDTMVYKYGASDARYHASGGMHLLFWEAIQEACATGCRALDLGRSDLDNDGLATFKDRWAAARSTLAYWREPAAERGSRSLSGYARQGLGYLPQSCRTVAGRLLYRHAG